MKLGFRAVPFLGFCVVLSACTTQEWYERNPPPPERCVIVSDGLHTVCVPESKVREWAQRNGL